MLGGVRVLYLLVSAQRDQNTELYVICTERERKRHYVRIREGKVNAAGVTIGAVHDSPKELTHSYIGARWKWKRLIAESRKESDLQT